MKTMNAAMTLAHCALPPSSPPAPAPSTDPAQATKEKPAATGEGDPRALKMARVSSSHIFGPAKRAGQIRVILVESPIAANVSGQTHGTRDTHTHKRNIKD